MKCSGSGEELDNRAFAGTRGARGQASNAVLWRHFDGFSVPGQRTRRALVIGAHPV